MLLLFIRRKIQDAFWGLEACIHLSENLTLKKKKKQRQPLNLGLSSKEVPPDERISNQVKFSLGSLETGFLNS